MNLLNDQLLAVAPIVAGPLQVLLTLLPGLLLATGTFLLSLFRPRTMRNILQVAWRLKIPLAAILAVGLGCFWTVRSLLSQNPPMAEEQGADWPTTRGDMRRSGVAKGSLAPTRGGLNWSWNRGHAIYCSPAVAGNRVYVTTAIADVLSDGRGEVVAIDTETGQTAWRSAPPGFRATVSSPVVVGNRLICGEGMHTVTDARVVCFDLTRGREGKVLWSLTTKSHVESTPLVHKDRVYVGAGDDGVYCLDIAGDGQGGAKIIWHLPGKKFPDVEASPAIWEHEGRTFLYFGLGVDGNGLCAVDAATGKEIRRIKTPYPVFGIPAIDQGKLYFGMGNGDLVRLAEEIGQPPGGAVWSIDLLRMNDPQAADPVDWKYTVPRAVLGAVVPLGDRIYFGSRDKFVYAVDLKGKLDKRWNARGRIVASPAVADDYLYVVTNGGVLYALHRQTLEPAWETTAGAAGLYLSSPILARGQLYVGTEAGLLSIGKADPDRGNTRLWPAALGGAGFAGNPQSEAISNLGAYHWSYPADQMGETTDQAVAGPIAAAGKALLVPLNKGRSGVARLPADAGAEEAPLAVWGDLEDGIFPTKNPVSLSPAISGDLVLAVDGVKGNGGRYLYAIDYTSGDEVWKTVLATYASGQFCVTTDEAFVQDSPEYLTCRLLAQRGRRRWTKRTGRLEQPPAVSSTLIVAATAEPTGVVVLDRVSGAVLANVSLDSPPTAAPMVLGKMVYIATKDQLQARDLADPDLAIRWSAPGVSGELAFREDRFVYITPKGELATVSQTDGKVERSLPGFLPGGTPLICRDQILAPGKEALLRVKLTGDDPPTPWTDTSWLGKPASPLVLHRGHVYQAREGWGLVRFGKSP